MWFYEIRGSNNRLVDRSKAVYISEEEALANGGERTKQLTNSVDAGAEVFSVMAGRKVDFIRPDLTTQKRG